MWNIIGGQHEAKTWVVHGFPYHDCFPVPADVVILAATPRDDHPPAFTSGGDAFPARKANDPPDIFACNAGG
jgi:hypothetical protein